MIEIGEPAINYAFREISKFERVSPTVSCIEKDYLAWHWKKTISNNPLIHLKFRIEFSPQFPLVWPKVYIAEETFEKIGWIPHLDSDRCLCLFVSHDTPDCSAPPNVIVFQAMQKAQKTVISGMERRPEDYSEEFLSYWKLNYDGTDDIVWKILLWGDVVFKKNSSIEVFDLKEHIGGCFCAVVAPDNQEQFENYLKFTKNQIESTGPAFYVGTISSFSRPPFLLKNKDICGVLVSNRLINRSNFRRYFSKRSRPIVLFQKELSNQKLLKLGWSHRKALVTREGFRNGIEQRLHLQKDDPIKRLAFEELSLKRLQNRTTGMEYEDSPSFLLMGVGSIGSNLVHFLNGYNPFWTFIDNDILKVENIGRHYLGLSYTGEAKTDAIKKFLVKKNPLIDVKSYNDDILEIIDGKLPEINRNDFIFSCLGEFNIQSRIGEYLLAGDIAVPIFFIWVEPYLAGGHCLYIPPKTQNYSDQFVDEFYKNNVIKPENYKNEELSLFLREAGCQTVYTPYAQVDVTLFLSALFPWVDKIIKSMDVSAQAFTWIGNQEPLKEKGVAISPAFMNKEQGEVQETIL